MFTSKIHYSPWMEYTILIFQEWTLVWKELCEGTSFLKSHQDFLAEFNYFLAKEKLLLLWIEKRTHFHIWARKNPWGLPFLRERKKDPSLGYSFYHQVEEFMFTFGASVLVDVYTSGFLVSILSWFGQDFWTKGNNIRFGGSRQSLLTKGPHGSQ